MLNMVSRQAPRILTMIFELNCIQIAIGTYIQNLEWKIAFIFLFINLIMCFGSLIELSHRDGSF